MQSAPQNVTIRLGRVGQAEVNDLRRMLRELACTAPRTIDVDFAGLDLPHKPTVFAVVIGAAREARRCGSTVRVVRPPIDLRRAFAVGQVAEDPAVMEPSYVIVVGQQGRTGRASRLVPVPRAQVV